MAKVALLIGVSEYEPGLTPLPAAVKDIEAMQRVLQDPEMGGFDEVKTLANPEPHSMQYAIETLFSSRTREDLVVLFFSGHGIKDDSGRLYFATRITSKNKKGDLIRSTAVPTSFVHDIMNNSRAKRQAIILDCCFSGAFDPALQAKDDGSVDLRSQLGAEGRVVLTSSSSTQYSFEQQGASLSLYTRYLIEGIETGAGDGNEDGFVSALELHNYAASKVQETAPNMTPKLIVMKEKGFEIILAKARVTDPKLKYRRTASRYAHIGTITPVGRAVLDRLKQQLNLPSEETAEIEAEVLRPFQERLANLEEYKRVLIEDAERAYPLDKLAREDLNTLQQMLGLRDEDISPIHQEIEQRFNKREADYQQKLARYEQEFRRAIDAEYPLNEYVLKGLQDFQQSLRLKDEDVERVENPIRVQSEAEHRQRLELEQQRIQEEQERLQQQQQKQLEYQQNLTRYEQEFRRTIGAEYPLSEYATKGLQDFQKSLGLKGKDIDQLERQIREQKEKEDKPKQEAKSRQQIPKRRQGDHKAQDTDKKDKEKRFAKFFKSVCPKKIIILLISFLFLNQVYSYFRYKSFPQLNPFFILTSLPSSQFLEKVLTVYTGTVDSLEFSPDGEYLASATGGSNIGDGSIYIWEILGQDKYNHHTFLNSTSASFVDEVSFSPDGKYLATTSMSSLSGSDERSNIQILEVFSETISKTFSSDNINSSVRSIQFSPNGQHLAVAADSFPGSNVIVTIFDFATGEIINEISKASDEERAVPWSIEFSPDGRYLALAENEAPVRLLEVVTGNTVSTFEIESSSVSFSPDGIYLATIDRNKLVVWEVATEERAYAIQDPPNVWASGIVSREVLFSPDGQHLASINGPSNRVNIWDVNTRGLTKSLHGASLVTLIAFSPNGKYLASGGDDRTIKIWRIK